VRYGAAVLIRDKTAEDTKACAVLMRLTHHSDGYPRYLMDDLEGFITSAAELAGWVVEDGGEIVGHLAVHAIEGDPTWESAHAATGLPPERLAVVARLMVHPRMRRRGMARRLLQTASAWAEKQGRRLVLDVLQESDDAIALYRRLGWRGIGAVTLPVNRRPDLQLDVFLAPDSPVR